MTTATLTLAPDLKLPLGLVTESVAILARKRAGKSHTAKKLVEQLHKAGQQVVIVDPKGDWWGIRSSKDGKGPGLPIVILGGEHGDVPLEVGSGELVARMVVEDRLSVLLDVSPFRKHEAATFLTAFLETLYRLKGKEQYRTPMMLVLEEADQVAPQKPYKGQERMLGAASDIVRLGGQRGIGIMVVTQRSAVLNKDVLTQAGILVLLQTMGSQDIDAVDEWIKKHGQPEERAKVMATIAAMPRGTAWIWAPGWPDEKGIFRQVQIAPCETFDSGATPKPGEKRIAPKTLADVDLEAFRREMAATIEKAKAEDPKALRAKIAQLEADNRKLQAATTRKSEMPAVKEKRIEVPVLSDQQLTRIEKIIGHLEGMSDKLDSHTCILMGALREVKDAVKAATQKPTQIFHEPIQQTKSTRSARLADLPSGVQSRVQTSGPASVETYCRLPVGERAILTAIAQYPQGATREQLTVLTGYKRSSRDAYIQRLVAKGLVELNGSLILVTETGIEVLGQNFTPLPMGKELQAYWLQRLPEGERKIFEVLIRHYPASIPREQLDEATGYKRSSRDAYLQRLKARQLVALVGRGAVKASEELFA